MAFPRRYLHSLLLLPSVSIFLTKSWLQHGVYCSTSTRRASSFVRTRCLVRARAQRNLPLSMTSTSATTPFSRGSLSRGGGAAHGKEERSMYESLAAQETCNNRYSETMHTAQDGMRREWDFSLLFVHQGARVALLCSPQWKPAFIDPECIGALNRLDRDVRHCPMMPILRYTDWSAVVRASSGTATGATSTAPFSNEHSSVSGHAVATMREEALTRFVTAPANDISDEMWIEKAKEVEVLYSHIAPGTTLEAYCIRSVQHMLTNRHVIAVDGDTDLAHLSVGSKLRCPYRLGGARSFFFRCRLRDKVQLMDDTVFAIGTIVGQRGYLVTVRCAVEEELNGYLEKFVLPHFTSDSKFRVDEDVHYSDVTSVVLREQQERYGELRYQDRNAAISFAVPMYPMSIRPDFSPTKTVGVGSIACMTLELNVHERLFDEAAVAEITNMPKYRVDTVVLCLDVEDVARMGYPSVMSTEQYSELKADRLLGAFADARVVGMPTTVQLGHRKGRSRTVTFAYDVLGGVVKAMFVSTLVGNVGVTALYLTKLSGGAFDSHLYLHQQFLRGVTYHEMHQSDRTFSRFHATNICLTERVLPRAYQCGDTGHLDEITNNTMERHLQLMRQSNNGRAEGAVAVPVPEEEGGLPRRRKGDVKDEEGAYRKAWHPRAASRGCPSIDFAADFSAFTEDGADAAAPVGEGDERRSRSSFESNCLAGGGSGVFGVLGVAEADMGANGGEGAGASAQVWEAFSQHSQSSISVTRISRLLQSESDLPDDTHSLWMSEYEEGRDSEVSTTGHTERLRQSIPNVDYTTADESVDSIALSSRARRSIFSPVSSVEHSCAAAPSSRVPLSILYATAQADSLLPTSLPGASGARRISGGEATDMLLVQCCEPTRTVTEEYTHSLQTALTDEAADVYFGPSLRDMYAHCCELQQCRPNSHLLQRLPTDPRLAPRVRELDLSSNYLGRNGFVAVLLLMEHITHLEQVFLNDMCLDNVDIEHLCEALARHPTVTTVHLRNNPRITLPATRYFTRLLRTNQTIRVLSLEGTRIGEAVRHRLEAEARHRNGVGSSTLDAEGKTAGALIDRLNASTREGTPMDRASSFAETRLLRAHTRVGVEGMRATGRPVHGSPGSDTHLPGDQ